MQWQLVVESLRAWAEQRAVELNDLGVRITYFAPPPRTEDSAPDCDFAVPFADRSG